MMVFYLFFKEELGGKVQYLFLTVGENKANTSLLGVDAFYAV